MLRIWIKTQNMYLSPDRRDMKCYKWYQSGTSSNKVFGDELRQELVDM